MTFFKLISSPPSSFDLDPKDFGFMNNLADAEVVILNQFLAMGVAGLADFERVAHEGISVESAVYSRLTRFAGTIEIPADTSQKTTDYWKASRLISEFAPNIKAISVCMEWIKTLQQQTGTRPEPQLAAPAPPQLWTPQVPRRSVGESERPRSGSAGSAPAQSTSHSELLSNSARAGSTLKRQTHVSRRPVLKSGASAAEAPGASASESRYPVTEAIQSQASLEPVGTITRFPDGSTVRIVDFSDTPPLARGNFGSVREAQIEVSIEFKDHLTERGLGGFLISADRTRIFLPPAHYLVKDVELEQLTVTAARIETRNGRELAIFTPEQIAQCRAQDTSKAEASVFEECSIGKALKIPGVMQVVENTTVYEGPLHDSVGRPAYVQQPNGELEPVTGKKITAIITRMPGKRLSDILADPDYLSRSPREKLQRMLPILRTIHDRAIDMKNARIVHRDLHPLNILVDETDQNVIVGLVDLGCAGHVGQPPVNPKISKVADANQHQFCNANDDLFQLSVLLLQVFSDGRSWANPEHSIWTPWGNSHSQYSQLKLFDSSIPRDLLNDSRKIKLDKTAEGSDRVRNLRSYDFPVFWHEKTVTYLKSAGISHAVATETAHVIVNVFNPDLSKRNFPKIQTVLENLARELK